MKSDIVFSIFQSSKMKPILFQSNLILQFGVMKLYHKYSFCPDTVFEFKKQVFHSAIFFNMKIIHPKIYIAKFSDRKIQFLEKLTVWRWLSLIMIHFYWDKCGGTRSAAQLITIAWSTSIEIMKTFPNW